MSPTYPVTNCYFVYNAETAAFKIAVRLLIWGTDLLSVHKEGIAVLYNTYHGFAGIEFNLIAIVVIVSGSAVIAGLLPAHMDALSVGEEISISCSIVYLEDQIPFGISYFVVCKLDKNVFERQLLAVPARKASTRESIN